MSFCLTILFCYIVSYGSQPVFPPINSSSLLVISANITVYVPWFYCLAENCPSPFGTCNRTSNTCEYIAPYMGLATYPEAFATHYCTLEPGGCVGVTQINPPYTTAGYIASNWSIPICQDMTTPETCVGIHASPSRQNGNAQTAVYVNNGSAVTNWGMGLTEASGVCFRLTGATGKQVIVAQTDRCGGYCECGSTQPTFEECGPCVNAANLTPNCPCVGTVLDLYPTCCGLSIYSCPATEVKCDWCASQVPNPTNPNPNPNPLEPPAF